jgi:hypothetical protein
MTTIGIDAVESKSALSEFIRLPPKIYKNFVSYSAPLTMERRTLLDPSKAPFFKHGEAQYWIARVGGQAVGRISAQIDHAQPTGTFDSAGLFGCLDAVDDAAVVHALIDTAETWLRDKGRNRAVGPCTLSMNGEPGLLIEGHAELPLLLVPWHPPYLASHVEASGYAKCQDLYYLRWRDAPENRAMMDRQRRLSTHRKDFSIRSIDFKNLDRDIAICIEVYNDAWKDNWGFVPILREDMEDLGKEMKPFLKSEYGIIAEIEGRPIAVALILPNLPEITRDLGGDPSLIGWAKLAYRTFFHRFRTGRIIIFGVRSEFQKSIGGAIIAGTLISEMSRTLLGLDQETDWIEAGWVVESNTAIQGIMKQYGFEVTRTLRLYDKTL